MAPHLPCDEASMPNLLEYGRATDTRGFGRLRNAERKSDIFHFVRPLWFTGFLPVEDEQMAENVRNRV
jgi:hypothetical protein